MRRITQIVIAGEKHVSGDLIVESTDYDGDTVTGLMIYPAQNPFHEIRVHGTNQIKELIEALQDVIR